MNVKIKINSRKFSLVAVSLLFFTLSSWAQKPQKLRKKEIKFIEEGLPNEAMRILKITNIEDSLFLRKKCKAVKYDKDIETITYFSKRLKKTVLDPKNLGVGIAAPQVGLQRMLIYVQRFDKDNYPMEFYINPQIIEYSDSTQLGKEGCLSIPDRTEEVFRAQSIKISYLDPDGKRHVEEVNGFTSVIFQHEIDHLNGILFIDHLRKEN